jgi:O-antigen/teichoic acid export membrane protein
MALIMALVCRPLSERIYGDPRHGTLLLLAAVAFASMLVLRSAQTYFQIDRRFPYFGLSDMANTLIRWGGAGVLLLQSAARPEPLMLLFALSPLVVAGASFLWKAQPLTRGWGDWTIARTLVRDSAWFLASAAAGSATARMDILLVSAWSGPREAGLFAAATNLVAPVQLLGQYLSIVFAPRIVPMRERGELAGVYPRVQLALAAAAAVLAVAFTALLAYAVTGISY